MQDLSEGCHRLPQPFALDSADGEIDEGETAHLDGLDFITFKEAFKHVGGYLLDNLLVDGELLDG